MKSTVSFNDEPLILVNPDDDILGYDTKLACHQGLGRLHRAFSVFVFDNNLNVLLQKRSRQKPLWPGYWANSCCSHPRKGEHQSDSVSRRLKEELGVVRMDAEFVYQFRYHAQYGDLGAEHELCSVYIGHYDGPLDINPTEIDDWRFVSAEFLDKAIESEPQHYTPWLKLEWPCLRNQHWSRIENLFPSGQAPSTT
jgi:isopentenyl-diphosphate delta-isomerase